MNSKQRTKVSRLLSLVLRHRPDHIDISLDAQGWTDVDTLLKRIAEFRRIVLTRADLDEVVETNDKQRFAYSEDRKKIRASQGHSVDVDLGLVGRAPPDTLYHGTASRFMKLIYESGGLEPRGRRHVHLSAESETARKVGARHGSPVVLNIDAARMFADGFEFYVSDNGVWLVGRVPVEYVLGADHYGSHGRKE